MWYECTRALSTTYELNINNHIKTNIMECVAFKVGYLQSLGLPSL